MDHSFLLDALTAGEWTEMGAIPRASNDTRLLVIEQAGRAIKAVYKPISGERPLHDFPEATLALREVAAFRLSDSLGLDVVPPTVLRHDLPAGPGSLQAYIEASDDDEAVTLTSVQTIPADHTPIFALRTEDGRDLVLSHAVGEGLRAIAFFDLLANNADRKAGHVITGSALPSTDARDVGIFGIDNGLTFHHEEKLRTVLWGFARTSFQAEEIDALEEIVDMGQALQNRLSDCLSTTEIAALRGRAETLLTAEFFPEAPENRTAIPWPPI
ncbi:SCO1664 family protein [Brevibacterium spongiae]|uniref:SCO1664 family protein n=1 Tax=Brevibacterium spongiae TaxID=2909672 RepID=A0ABY5SJR9_9MICO|nr:SCO1664 family protein [Brevibacterium spongiae]UVI34400.1 SCO1664 family protein [Brevibacterium spongiae]